MPRGEYLCDSEHNPYYNAYAAEGQEVSSTFEGRHVSVSEGWLYHNELPDKNGLVQKGQPVSFGGGIGAAVGIAVKTASSIDDILTIDTEGVWRVPVWATADIVPGQMLWIGDNGGAEEGVILDDPLISGDFPLIFGYAMEPFTFSPNGDFNVVVMAVKVHWMFWFWWFGGA